MIAYYQDKTSNLSRCDAFIFCAYSSHQISLWAPLLSGRSQLCLCSLNSGPLHRQYSNQLLVTSSWLLYWRSEIEQTCHFYSLFARQQHGLFDDRRMKIESSILSSSGKELSCKSTVGAVSWMIDVFKKLQKKRNYRFPGGGGGCESVPS